MAAQRDKDEARKSGKKAAAPETAQDEAGESSLVVREPDDLAEPPAEGAADPDATEEESEEEAAARQLGTDRYVMAGFFAAGIIGAYVLGRALHGIWAELSNKDWFSRAVPAFAAVSDDDKSTYATVLAGLIAVVVTLRTYRRPDVRVWTDDVASELMKVKWPTKKEVSNSTMVVIAASAAATIYLALLDRLWSFVTGIVYGTGS
ncbi:preprotein translocase subunit SecE [Polyangium aurulentum]|uniref:preprotein translocase subunit SecE n=1 Tax=Polyangium aurulentum TaxID=2567896 RepID=UPI001F475752|nr:preprotein translocase subunit SecE [Polyangium aurulentum]